MSARSAGTLTGGGPRGHKRRRNVIEGGSLAHMPDVHLSDAIGIKREVWDFDPLWEFEYSPRELLLMAEKILLMDERPPYEEPVWLPLKALTDREKKEIYTANGTPDPSVASGMYWRTHPLGRKFKTYEERQVNRDSFYR